MRPTLPLLCGLALLAACSESSSVAPNSSAPPTAEEWKAAARVAAATIDGAWMASRLAVLAGDEMEGRDNLTAGGARAREWLEAQMTEIGLEPLGTNGFEQAFDKGVNLIGRIAGRDPALADEYVIVSGHYDHLGVVGAPRSQCRASALAPGDMICNGAADNGAGTIAALSIAQALAHSDLGTRRSILVVLWDAEEDGLLGSHHFADTDPRVPLEQIAAMYSVDNVGAYIIRGVDDSFAIGTEYADGLREKIQAVNAETGFNQWPVSSFFVGSDTGGRSDHLPFRLHRVPVIFFGSGSPPQYHTPADEIGIVSFVKLEKIARHVALMTADVANDDARPIFVDNPQPQLDDARALVALGQVVLADPSSLGIDDPVLVGVLKGWMTTLNRYLANPPDTEQEWASYQTFVKSIITTIYGFIGGEDEQAHNSR
jgi:hypothetical protein